MMGQMALAGTLPLWGEVAGVGTYCPRIFLSHYDIVHAFPDQPPSEPH